MLQVLLHALLARWVEFLLGAHYPAWGILGLLYARACPGRLADFGLAERLDLGVREAGPVRHAGGIDKRQLVIKNLNFFEVSNLACARHPDLDQRRAGVAPQEDTTSAPGAVRGVRDAWMILGVLDHHQAARAMQQQSRIKMQLMRLGSEEWYRLLCGRHDVAHGHVQLCSL